MLSGSVDNMVFLLILSPVSENNIIVSGSVGKLVRVFFHPDNVIRMDISVQISIQAVYRLPAAVVSEEIPIRPGNQERLDLIVHILVYRQRNRNIFQKGPCFR